MLTKRHKILLNELNKISSILGLDTEKIIAFWDGDNAAITAQLESIKDHVIRGEIIFQYTYFDFMLNFELSEHFLGRDQGSRTKKVETFELILEELPTIKKYKIIKSYKSIPKNIGNSISDLIKLRNAFAHKIVPPKSKSVFKNRDVFSPEGLEFFLREMDAIVDFFQPFLNPKIKKLIEQQRLGSYAQAVTSLRENII